MVRRGLQELKPDLGSGFCSPWRSSTSIGWRKRMGLKAVIENPSMHDTHPLLALHTYNMQRTHRAGLAVATQPALRLRPPFALPAGSPELLHRYW